MNLLSMPAIKMMDEVSERPAISIVATVCFLAFSDYFLLPPKIRTDGERSFDISCNASRCLQQSRNSHYKQSWNYCVNSLRSKAGVRMVSAGVSAL